MEKKAVLTLGLAFGLMLWSCGGSGNQTSKEKEQSSHPKVVSLSGAITETLFSIGAGNQLVGVDVTSTAPSDSLKNRAIPVLGHVNQLNVEAILGLNGDMVLAADSLKPELLAQLEAGGMEINIQSKPKSLEETAALILRMGALTGRQNEAEQLHQHFEAEREALKKQVEDLTVARPKVVFVYGRGAGSLMVAGGNTQANGMIEEVAGENPFAGQFEGFKPLTAESMVEASPDVLLFFSDAFEMLGGVSGIKEIPGVAATPAGNSERFIHMDGHYMMGFGPRAAQAAQELFEAIHSTRP